MNVTLSLIGSSCVQRDGRLTRGGRSERHGGRTGDREGSRVGGDESENEVESRKVTFLLQNPRLFARFTKIKISPRLLGVGSSALDMFQMTF